MVAGWQPALRSTGSLPVDRYGLSPLFELCVLVGWLQAGSLHYVAQAACLLIDTT